MGVLKAKLKAPLNVEAQRAVMGMRVKRTQIMERVPLPPGGKHRQKLPKISRRPPSQLARLEAKMAKVKPLPTDTEIRQHLIDAGVKNLTEWGLVGVTAENILTDRVFRPFFDSMLEQAPTGGRYIIDRAIKKLRQEIAHVQEEVRDGRGKD